MEALLQNQVVEAIAMTLDRVNESGQLPMGTIPSPMVEPPKRPEWGDFSCNVAMTLASTVRQPPLKVAGILAMSLREQFSELFERIDVAPPGFLNLTLHPLRWMGVLRTIEEHGSAYGESQIGKGKRIVLEFVSANPTGPLHVGHGRGAALGQAMASLLASAGLSFLGIGAKPPLAEWGLMINEARAFFLDFWWTTTFPGIAIFVAVVGFNLLGDGLRDVLDPKVR